MTQLKDSLPPQTSQRRLILGQSHPPISPSRIILQGLTNKSPVAKSILEDICKIFRDEIAHHVNNQPLVEEQRTYLVGWHDALHTLRHLASRLPPRATFNHEEAPIAGVPNKPSFADDASIQDAAETVLCYGRKFMDVPFSDAARASQSGFGRSNPDNVVISVDLRSPFASSSSSSSSNPMNSPSSTNISTSVHNLLATDPRGFLSPPAADNHLLNASSALRGIDTNRLLLNYEREARLSEQKIIAELAKSRLMRQSVFQDRFFGNIPSFDWSAAEANRDFYNYGADINQFLVSDRQQMRTLADVKRIFRDWRLNESPNPTSTTAPQRTSRQGWFGNPFSNTGENANPTPLAPPPPPSKRCAFRREIVRPGLVRENAPRAVANPTQQETWSTTTRLESLWQTERQNTPLLFRLLSPPRNSEPRSGIPAAKMSARPSPSPSPPLGASPYHPLESIMDNIDRERFLVGPAATLPPAPIKSGSDWPSRATPARDPEAKPEQPVELQQDELFLETGRGRSEDNQ